MSNRRNLDSFFLEWRDTCAIDKCPAKGPQGYLCTYKAPGETNDAYVLRIKEDIQFVHAMYDKRFRDGVNQVRTFLVTAKPKKKQSKPTEKKGTNEEKEEDKTPQTVVTAKGIILSGYRDYMVGEEGCGHHAFHLLETQVYGKKINGRPFKDSVFSHAKTPGGVNGYMKSVLRTLVDESFDTKKQGGIFGVETDHEDEIAARSGDVLPGGGGGRGTLKNGSGKHSIVEPVKSELEFQECLEDFDEVFREVWRKMEPSAKLAVLCMKHHLPLTTPAALEAVGLERDSKVLYARKSMLHCLLEKLFERGHDWMTVMQVCSCHLEELLEELEKHDQDCTAFAKLFGKTEDEGGKRAGVALMDNGDVQ